jgi:hypothetical protein
MSWKSAAPRTLAIASALAVVACSDAPNPTGPAGRPSAAAAAVDLTAQLGDPQLAAVARAVPGFGGFFLDGGVPTVYLKDARQRDAAARALAGFASAHDISLAGLAVRRADYDVAQLGAWFGAMSPQVAALPGVAFVDLDEASNRLLVGVESGAVTPAVLGATARLGVPAAAVVVRQVPPIRQLLTLQQRARPVRGGFQINFPGFLCTLGFNATAGGVRSFITNSHCTSVQGGVEGTQYWQPTQAGNNFIGTEVADPTYSATLPGCPAGRLCRMSDAARATYAAGAGSALRRIARTTGPNNGSLTIGSPANFTITAEGGATVGQMAHKVGRTTGWTRGQVTNTCVTTNVSGSVITQLCQTFVSAGVNSGDSGSPVFRVTSGTNVRLVGILWGGSGTTLYVFSPLTNVEQELGPLTTF